MEALQGDAATGNWEDALKEMNMTPEEVIQKIMSDPELAGVCSLTCCGVPFEPPTQSCDGVPIMLVYQHITVSVAASHSMHLLRQCFECFFGGHQRLIHCLSSPLACCAWHAATAVIERCWGLLLRF